MKTLFPNFPNPAASHNLINFPFHAQAPSASRLTPQPHASRLTPQPHALRLSVTSPAHNLIHSITLSQLSHALSHTATSPQAVKHRQSVADLTLSPHCHKPTALYSLKSQLRSASLSSISPSHSLFPSHLPRPWPHGLAPPRSPSFSFFFFLFFFWVQFVSNSQCEFVFVIVILKGKIIDPKVVFRISVFMFVIVFGFVSVFVILGRKIIDRSLCFWFWAWLGMRDGARGARGGPTGRVWGKEKNPFNKRAGFGFLK